jgi:hypothetical protein
MTVAVHCGDRFCSVCNGSRIRRVRRRLAHLFDRVRPTLPFSLRFVTLTIPNMDDPLAAVRHLIASFKRLRQSREWKRLVTGGAYVIEITRSSGSWHAHIHAVTEGKFFPVHRLSKAWQRASGGKIVWIQRVGPGRHLIWYLTKYITKCNVPDEFRLELSAALRGVHLFQPFGRWHGINLECPSASPCCPRCGNDHWVYIPGGQSPDREFVVLNGGPDPP